MVSLADALYYYGPMLLGSAVLVVRFHGFGEPATGEARGRLPETVDASSPCSCEALAGQRMSPAGAFFPRPSAKHPVKASAGIGIGAAVLPTRSCWGSHPPNEQPGLLAAAPDAGNRDSPKRRHQSGPHAKSTPPGHHGGEIGRRGLSAPNTVPGQGVDPTGVCASTSLLFTSAPGAVDRPGGDHLPQPGATDARVPGGSGEREDGGAR